MIPFIRNVLPWFAFLIHPRGPEDADRVGIGQFLRSYSRDEEDYRRRFGMIPAFVSGEVRFRSTVVNGELICIARFPERMLEPEARLDVVAAVRLAIQRGAKVIGLGALTASATGGGLTLIRDISRHITVTNGNALTAAIVRQNVVSAARSLCGSKQRNAVVAIVGCTGSVGAAATRLIRDAGFRLVLVGRSRLRVEREFGDVPTIARTDRLADIRLAQIVVLLTSDPSARLTPDLPAGGSIIIDCAQPPSIPATAYGEFAKRAITVVEGGLVRIPDYSNTDSFGLRDRRDTFACLAETYVVTRCGLRGFYVGRRTPEEAIQIERLATRLGVEPRPLEVA